VDVSVEQTAAPKASVGIDLGIKDVAVTSDGERLEANRFIEMLNVGSAPCNDEGICGRPSGCIDGSGVVGRMPAISSAAGW